MGKLAVDRRAEAPASSRGGYKSEDLYPAVPLKMVGYVRVSTSQQADSGAGLEAQREAIRVEIQRRGWELAEMVEDAGSSGKSIDRPGLERALRACRTGEVSGIVVAKLDRLTRSVVDFGGLLQEAQRGGWNLLALDFGLDLSTPQGELLANVLVSVSQWERKIIGARTRDALAVKRSAGVRLGRPPALPVAVVERLQRARKGGATFQRIADDLNAEGIATGHGGSQWHRATVGKVLTSQRARS
jgi:DNA invertase Pin-like site-specific DNA recombinase